MICKLSSDREEISSKNDENASINIKTCVTFMTISCTSSQNDCLSSHLCTFTIFHFSCSSFCVALHLAFTFTVFGESAIVHISLSHSTDHTPPLSPLSFSFSAVLYVCRTPLWLPGGLLPPPLLQHLLVQLFRGR